MAYYRKRDNGWEYRISYKTPDGKYKQKSKSGFRTKSEASLAAAKAEQALTQTITVDTNITLADYFQTWMETFKKPRLTKGTWKNYEYTLIIVRKYFGTTKLVEITNSNYQKFLNDLGQNYYQGTINSLHHRLRSCIKYAVADQIISHNFTDLAVISALHKSKPLDEKFLELDEYQKLLENLKNNITNRCHMELYLIAVTGMRISECLGLTWADIDLEKGLVDINKTWDCYDKTGFMPTKNPQSIRTIPIDDTTCQLLIIYKTNCWHTNQFDRVFFKSGRVILNKYLKKLVKRNVHIHSLRHTYTSYLITQGIELLTVSKIIGHKDLTTTLKVYAHLLEDKKARDFQIVRSLFK